MILFTSLFSFTTFITFFVLVSADRERDSWTQAKLDPNTPKCKPLMSEETLKMYNENYKTADNEEIRIFYVCMLQNAGYMTDDKIYTDIIMKDFEKYYQPNDKGRTFGLNILKSCNDEAEACSNINDAAGKFVKCIFKNIASEI